MLPASGSLLLLLLLFSKPNWNLLAERFLYAPACWLSPFCALTRSTPLRDFPFSLLLHFPPSHFFIWFLLPRTRIDIHLCAPAMLSIYFILFYSLSLSTLFRERERECPLSWVDRFQTTASATPAGSLFFFFFFCFHFLPFTFFFRLAREKYLTCPAKLFCLPIDIRRRLDWYCLVASIYNAHTYHTTGIGITIWARGHLRNTGQSPIYIAENRNAQKEKRKRKKRETYS